MKSLWTLCAGMVFSLSVFAGGQAWEVLDTTYTVPVPEELAPYASFPGVKVKHRIRKGRAEFIYDLPFELTGKPVEVHARDVDGSGTHFKGEISDMTCTEKECVVRYPGLALDAQQVQDSLAAKGVQGEELKARMAVFARFDGGDPAGVIHFSTSPDSR